LNACVQEPHPYLDLFAKLLILTCARSSEARLSLWSHYDIEARIWTVPISKNGRSRRIVLSTAALALLDEIRARTESLMLPIGRQDYLFLNPRLKRPYDSFHAAWDRARCSVGMPQVRIHDLRHTYASLLINNGACIYEVQTLLGHHNVSMTQRYAHLAPSTLQTRVEMVAGLLD
jgi:integrase